MLSSITHTCRQHSSLHSVAHLLGALLTSKSITQASLHTTVMWQEPPLICGRVKKKKIQPKLCQASLCGILHPFINAGLSQQFETSRNSLLNLNFGRFWTIWLLISKHPVVGAKAKVLIMRFPPHLHFTLYSRFLQFCTDFWLIFII